MTRQQFSEKTLIPVSFLLMVGGSVLGLAVWLTTMYNEVQAHGKKLDERSAFEEKVADDISKIRQEISGIHGELRRINK